MAIAKGIRLMMYFDIKVGESLLIDNTKVTLLSKTGQRARLSIDAPKNIIVKKISHQDFIPTTPKT